jgi:hypothetical protein
MFGSSNSSCCIVNGDTRSGANQQVMPPQTILTPIGQDDSSPATGPVYPPQTRNFIAAIHASHGDTLGAYSKTHTGTERIG